MNGIKQVSLAFPIVELKGRKKTYEETSKALREMPNARLLWQLTKESKVRKGKRCSEFHEVWDLRKVVGEDDLSIYRLWQAFKVSVPLSEVINEFEQPTEVRADHYFKADGNLDACHIDAWFNEQKLFATHFRRCDMICCCCCCYITGITRSIKFNEGSLAIRI